MRGYSNNPDNRQWNPTVADIRNITKANGMEVERLEEQITILQSNGDSVHYMFEPDQVSCHKML